MSNKVALVLLGVVALTCSRLLFVFINDPEGPNLVVVVGLTALVYAASLAVFAYSTTSHKKFVLAVAAQIVIVIGLYIALH